MKRSVAVLAAVACLALLAVTLISPVQAAGDKPRIAVISFENKAGWGGYRLGDQAADMLVTQLVKTQKFSVFERDKLASILQEQNLGESGRVDPKTAAKIGKLAGVEFMVVGAVTQFGKQESGAHGMSFGVSRSKYSGKIDVRLINVTTGEIVNVWEEESSSSNVKVSVMGIGGGVDYDEKIAHEVLQDSINKVSQQIATSAGK